MGETLDVRTIGVHYVQIQVSFVIAIRNECDPSPVRRPRGKGVEGGVGQAQGVRLYGTDGDFTFSSFSLAGRRGCRIVILHGHLGGRRRGRGRRSRDRRRGGRSRGRRRGGGRRGCGRRRGSRRRSRGRGRRGHTVVVSTAGGEQRREGQDGDPHRGRRQDRAQRPEGVPGHIAFLTARRTSAAAPCAP